MCLEIVTMLSGFVFSKAIYIPEYQGRRINLPFLQILLIKCLLHSRPLTKHLTCIGSFNPNRGKCN